MSTHRLWTWLREVWRWLGDGKVVFMCLLVIAAAVTFGFYTGHSKESINQAGYALQLIGMIFAMRGLLLVRAHFGQAPFRTLLHEWLWHFPKWKRNVVVGTGAMNTSAAFMNAYIEVWCPDKPDHPPDKRIEDIVKNQERIRIILRESAHQFDALKKDHEEHKKHTAERVKRTEEEVHSNLESLHTSDLLPALVGLVWLTVGITMSTLSTELSCWFH